MTHKTCTAGFSVLAAMCSVSWVLIFHYNLFVICSTHRICFSNFEGKLKTIFGPEKPVKLVQTLARLFGAGNMAGDFSLRSESDLSSEGLVNSVL